METFLESDILGLANGKQLMLIIHLFGLALGAGAAFFSDFLFTDTLKDHKISSKEYTTLKLASLVVWLGLVVLIVSGSIIFLGNYESQLHSPKFLAKMSVVGILTLNGLVFHYKHMPLLRQSIGKDLRKNKLFIRSSKSFFLSGALSGVSWASAIVLGAMRYINHSYFMIMAVYFAAVILAFLPALALHHYYFKSKNNLS